MKHILFFGTIRSVHTSHILFGKKADFRTGLHPNTYRDSSGRIWPNPILQGNTTWVAPNSAIPAFNANLVQNNNEDSSSDESSEEEDSAEEDALTSNNESSEEDASTSNNEESSSDESSSDNKKDFTNKNDPRGGNNSNGGNNSSSGKDLSGGDNLLSEKHELAATADIYPRNNTLSVNDSFNNECFYSFNDVSFLDNIIKLQDFLNKGEVPWYPWGIACNLARFSLNDLFSSFNWEIINKILVWISNIFQ